jgi:hypothetical protein
LGLYFPELSLARVLSQISAKSRHIDSENVNRILNARSKKRAQLILIATNIASKYPEIVFSGAEYTMMLWMTASASRTCSANP